MRSITSVMMTVGGVLLFLYANGVPQRLKKWWVARETRLVDELVQREILNESERGQLWREWSARHSAGEAQRLENIQRQQARLDRERASFQRKQEAAQRREKTISARQARADELRESRRQRGSGMSAAHTPGLTVSDWRKLVGALGADQVILDALRAEDELRIKFEPGELWPSRHPSPEAPDTWQGDVDRLEQCAKRHANLRHEAAKQGGADLLARVEARMDYVTAALKDARAGRLTLTPTVWALIRSDFERADALLEEVANALLQEVTRATS